MATQTQQVARKAVQPVAVTATGSVAAAPGVTNTLLSATPAFLEPEQRCAMIAEAAYYHAEHRGFESGHELEDWLAAEEEIDGLLTQGQSPVVPDR